MKILHVENSLWWGEKGFGYSEKDAKTFSTMAQLPLFLYDTNGECLELEFIQDHWTYMDAQGNSKAIALW